MEYGDSKHKTGPRDVEGLLKTRFTGVPLKNYYVGNKCRKGRESEGVRGSHEGPEKRVGH